MFRKLAIAAFLVFSAVLFLTAAGAAFADELKTLSDSTKVYDIVKSPWTMAKKAEIVSAIDLFRKYDELEKNKWYNPMGYFKALKEVNEKRKVFLEASRQRIMLEQQLAREGRKDFGQTVYNAIITGADMWARYANNDGPIFSQLISSYDNMILKMAEYSQMTWMTPIKKFKKFKEVKDASKYAYQTARRFEQSNTYDQIKGVIDRMQGNSVINGIGGVIGGNGGNNGIGGIINTIGNIFRDISSIGNTIGGALGTVSGTNASQVRGEGASDNMPAEASGQNRTIQGTASGDIFSSNSAEYYTQKHQQYIKLLEQYYEAVKAGRSTEELSGQLEEIKKLKKELGIN